MALIVFRTQFSKIRVKASAGVAPELFLPSCPLLTDTVMVIRVKYMFSVTFTFVLPVCDMCTHLITATITLTALVNHWCQNNENFRHNANAAVDNQRAVSMQLYACHNIRIQRIISLLDLLTEAGKVSVLRLIHFQNTQNKSTERVKLTTNPPAVPFNEHISTECLLQIQPFPNPFCGHANCQN